MLHCLYYFRCVYCASRLRFSSTSSISEFQKDQSITAVLNNDQSRGEWEAQCKAMADRLNSVRASLYQALVDLKVKGTWKHVIEQRGMFSYTGISAAVVARLKNEHHIYMLSNGRISLAGLNSSNTIRFAEKLALILGTNE